VITRTRFSISNSAVCPKKLDCVFIFLLDRCRLFHISLFLEGTFHFMRCGKLFLCCVLIFEMFKEFVIRQCSRTFLVFSFIM